MALAAGRAALIRAGCRIACGAFIPNLHRKRVGQGFSLCRPGQARRRCLPLCVFARAPGPCPLQLPRLKQMGCAMTTSMYRVTWSSVAHLSAYALFCPSSCGTACSTAARSPHGGTRASAWLGTFPASTRSHVQCLEEQMEARVLHSGRQEDGVVSAVRGRMPRRP